MRTLLAKKPNLPSFRTAMASEVNASENSGTCGSSTDENGKTDAHT